MVRFDGCNFDAAVYLFLIPTYLFVLTKHDIQSSCVPLSIAAGGHPTFCGERMRKWFLRVVLARALHCVRNKRMPAIGDFMKTAIEDAYYKRDMVCNVKYIDPSYMIR